LLTLSNQFEVSWSGWFELAHPRLTAFIVPMWLFLAVSALLWWVCYDLGWFGLVPWLILFPPWQGGLTVIALALVRGDRWHLSAQLAGFRWWLALCILHLLLFLIAAALLALPAWIVLEDSSEESRAVGLGLGLVGGGGLIYFAVRGFFFAVPLIVDRDYNAWQAIKGSWTLSRGHFWQLFIPCTALLCINGFTVALFFLPLVVTLPYTFLVATAGYVHSLRDLSRHTPALPLSQPEATALPQELKRENSTRFRLPDN
jgi:hypothetical protein